MRLGQNEKIAETVENLQKAKVSTIISIERPSVTQYDGGLYSMLGLDVSPYNTDMSPVLGSGEYRPFTIGIGDGGNELGTGGIQEKTANLRGPDLKPVVKRGEFIGAKREHATDVMLLSSASNSGGIALAMAFEAGMKAVADDVWRADLALKLLKNYETKKQAHEGSVYQQRVNAKKEMDTAKDALDKSTRAHAASFAAYEKPRKQLDDIIESYPRIIKHMHGEGMSLDGVNKENYETVDGRRVGTLREARKRFEEQEGVIRLGIGPVAEKPEGRDEDSTHNDLFLAFRKALTSEPFKVTTQ
jgi:hypothetical protein